MLGFALVLNSCRKDEDYIVPETLPNEVIDVVGRIVNENGEGLANTNLVVASKAAVSDENGFFSFKDIDLASDGNVLIANRFDRFSVSRILSPTPNGRNEITIQLKERTLVGSVNPTTGGVVEFDGAIVEFPPYPFGADVSNFGTNNVNIYAKRLNPENIQDITAIPGDLSAINSNNETVQLASYSMIALEMTTTFNDKVSLGENVKAKIKFPIDDSLLGGAPSTIPLWHYDIEQGKWIEEGEAELINGVYEGSVSHFSWWNCDAPFPVVKMDVTVVDPDGEPVVGAIVFVKIVGSGLCSWATTNSEGFICGKVPKEEALTLTIASFYECLDFDLSVNIDPLTENTSLPDIVLDEEASYTSELSATFVDCNLLPLDNIYVLLTYGNRSTVIYTDENGNFNYRVPKCLDNFNLIAYDFENQTKSNLIEFSDGLSDDLALGTLTVCEENITYVNINIGDETYYKENLIANGEIVYTIENDSLEIDSLSFFASLPIEDTFIEGKQNPNQIIFQILKAGTDEYLYQLICGNAIGTYSCENFEVELTHVGPKGDFVTGTFTGILYDEPNNYKEIQVSGDFKAAHN